MTKICPWMSYIRIDRPKQCIGKNCGVWSEKENCCAISLIGRVNEAKVEVKSEPEVKELNRVKETKDAKEEVKTRVKKNG